MADTMSRSEWFLTQLNRKVGKWICWLALAIVLLQFSIVILRYVYGISYIFCDEAVLYLHAALFMVGSGYTLQVGGHVRVDVIYSGLTTRQRAGIDLFGGLVFLIPAMVMVILACWSYVYNSWSILEGAISVGGIPASFLLKSLIPVFAVLLVMQGVADILATLRVLRAGPKEILR